MSANSKSVSQTIGHRARLTIQSRDRKEAVLQSGPVLAIFKGLVGLAGAAAFVPSAVAQDCKLTVQAAPQVLYTGQSTRIHVYACPSRSTAPNAPYAFAFAAFDVLATDPLWSFATDGVIVDSGGVLGIEVGQDHQPELGIYADPSNPYRVWGGIMKPLSDEPAMVEIEANPSSFFVYPSKDTSSSVQVYAQAGNDVVLINPISVGRWLAAPGQGTTISVADDVVIDGKIITGENWDTVSVGTTYSGPILLNSTHSIEFDTQPVTFTATVQATESGDDFPIESISLNYGRADDDTGGSGYIVGANVALSDGSVRFFAYDGFLGGVSVASGDLDPGSANEIPGLVVYDLPQTLEAATGKGSPVLSNANSYLGFTTVYDQPIVATIRDSKGLPQIVTLDRIEFHGGQAAKWAKSSNNLKQLGIGCHVFEAEGVKEMWVTPSQGD